MVPRPARTDSDYLRQLGVEPKFKRALGFVTGSLFAVAFQGPTTGALLITGATLALGGPGVHLGHPDHLRCSSCSSPSSGPS